MIRRLARIGRASDIEGMNIGPTRHLVHGFVHELQMTSRYGMGPNTTCSRTEWYGTGLPITRRYASKRTQTPVSITLV